MLAMCLGVSVLSLVHTDTSDPWQCRSSAFRSYNLLDISVQLTSAEVSCFRSVSNPHKCQKISQFRNLLETSEQKTPVLIFSSYLPSPMLSRVRQSPHSATLDPFSAGFRRSTRRHGLESRLRCWITLPTELLRFKFLTETEMSGRFVTLITGTNVFFYILEHRLEQWRQHWSSRPDKHSMSSCVLRTSADLAHSCSLARYFMRSLPCPIMDGSRTLSYRSREHVVNMNHQMFDLIYSPWSLLLQTTTGISFTTAIIGEL